jgi:hypothetical protein
MNEFLRSCGFALLLGGVLHILITVFLTPAHLASFKQGEAVARISGLYVFRLSAALVDALLLIHGCIGLYLAQKSVSGLFGTIAFGAAFIGTILLFALEWSNLFVLRAIAQTSPETLAVLDKSRLMTIGFASGAGIFMLGWLLLAANTWQANVLPRWASISTVAGLILIPVLGATPLGIAGQVIGNVVFGLGLIGFGYSLIQIA